MRSSTEAVSGPILPLQRRGLDCSPTVRGTTGTKSGAAMGLCEFLTV